MREWLTDALLASAATIPEEAEGYCLGRGLPYRVLQDTRVGLWTPPEAVCPNPTYRDRYGPHGERVARWLSFPLWSPRGRVLGVEYRRWDGEKAVQKYHLPESAWTPVFGGMSPSAIQRIWKGGDVWLVEGVFDLALAHAIPEKDVALACGGAKITPAQLRFLQRFLAPRAMVHVCFDMDQTGQNMASGYTHPETGKHVWGVVERLTHAKVRSRLVQYRGGKDPGEIWERGGTPALKHALAL